MPQRETLYNGFSFYLSTHTCYKNNRKIKQNLKLALTDFLNGDINHTLHYLIKFLKTWKKIDQGDELFQEE